MSSPIFSFGILLTLAGSVAACDGTVQEAPLRSPTGDYRIAPPTDANGEVVGADGVEPADKLEQEPKLGTKSALAPGWSFDKRTGLSYDATKRVGGTT